ncbi:hypothetical protein KIN20_038445 [Parelaphostrongylus tenuis]|uniref:PiggyBac transposable element-derived protein domain-containing protein n=1 Tax=Parelaphostrongylus tenuis TaxID=148309 RepID=A0AAD5R285_PARTN|nr:hypothetical protein KIN20_038445 [Parelaphostrongylus tenuis]
MTTWTTMSRTQLISTKIVAQKTMNKALLLMPAHWMGGLGMLSRPKIPPFNEQRAGLLSDVLRFCARPVDFYELFMKDVWQLVVEQTNIFGKQKNECWEETTVDEIKRFIGLCLKMSVDRLPRINQYWSSHPAFAGVSVASNIMTRTRFFKIMGHLHLADNSRYYGKNRLYKINSLLQLVNRNCKAVYRPGRNVCIDESTVPFRGSIVFRQHNPLERNKYGIKLYKVCDEGGYTYQTMTYVGEGTNPRPAGRLAEHIVMSLMDDLLGEGRHLYADDWYTSVPLAESLLQKETYLTGTCRKSGVGLPKQLLKEKLRNEEWIAMQNQSGVMILKWKNIREVIMVSTAHGSATDPETGLLEVVETYKKQRPFVGFSDQMAAYSPYLRRTYKWYIRVFFHLVTHICLLNAWIIYRDYVRNITFIEFKKQVYLSYLTGDIPRAVTSRVFVRPPATSRPCKRCVECYRKLARGGNAQYARLHARKTCTRCSHCRMHVCIECFNSGFHICDPKRFRYLIN